MLRLRREQARVLHRAYLEGFLRRAVATVSRHWPQLRIELDEGELRARVRRGIRRAEARGLVTEGQILRWINVECALGEDFSDDPSRREIRALLDANPDPQVLVDRLSDLTLVELQRRGDPYF